MESGADDVHGFDVMDCHQVETEAVDVIFLNPPFEGLDHVFAVHRLLGSGFISAT